MRRWFRIGLLSGLLMIVAGCWDRKEINDIGFVMATALDTAENGMTKVTIQVAVPSPSSQTGGAPKDVDRFFLISAVGRNGMDIQQLLQQKMSRTLIFSHRSVILIGESMAKLGINPMMDAFSRNPRNRLKTFILVVKGDEAGDLLKVQYPYELAPAEALKEMEMLQGEGVTATLRDYFIDSVSEGTYPAIGVLEPAVFYSTAQKKEAPLYRIRGTAVFKSGKLAGYLNNDDTHEFLWFKYNKKTDKIAAELPEGLGDIGYYLTKRDTKISVDTKGETLKFHINLKGKGNLFENNSPLDINNPKHLKLIKQALEDRVKQDMARFLRKIQTEIKADIVGFGQRLQRKNPRKWRKIADDWDRYFAKAEMNVTVSLNINNTGAIGPGIQWQEKEIVK